MLLKPQLAYVKLSTLTVDNSVDGAGVSIPSAGSAGQFCGLASFCAAQEILNENMWLHASNDCRTRLVQALASTDWPARRFHVGAVIVPDAEVPSLPA